MKIKKLAIKFVQEKFLSNNQSQITEDEDLILEWLIEFGKKIKKPVK